MAYGLEVVPIDNNAMEELEKAHRQHARMAQNLPTISCNAAVLANFGWLSMESYIRIGKMLFFVYSVPPWLKNI